MKKLICLFLVLLLTGCASKAQEPFRKALIGSEETILALGGQPDYTTPLSEQEIQELIDAYNARVDAYFTLDSVFCQRYKGTNEAILRGEMLGNVSSLIESGVLSCEIESVKQEDDTAQVTATVIGYNLFVVYEIVPPIFRIMAPVNKKRIIANMVKEDDTWKVQEHEENTILEEWTLDGTDTAYQYERYEDALAAAQEIDVAALCPLTAED